MSSSVLKLITFIDSEDDLNVSDEKMSNEISSDTFSASEFVTVLACVTRKMLGKEMLGHLGGVEQYYR